MTRDRLFAIAVLVAPLAAQTPTALREVGRTTVLGADVERCVFDRDGAHMLTVGDEGDFVWWDVAALRPLARVPALAPYVTALALHPTEPWVVVGATDGDFASGRVLALDLSTGTSQLLWRRYAEDACVDAAGARIAVAFRGDGDLQLEVFACGARPPTPDATPLHRAACARAGNPHLVFGPDGSSLYCSGLQMYSAGDEHIRIGLEDGAQQRGDGAIVAFARSSEPIVATGGSHSFAGSPDGHTAARLGSQRTTKIVERLSPEPATWDCRPDVDSWLNRLWASPDGTVVAADVQGQLHVLGPEPGRRRLASGHPGIATGLTWSPDGRYLAVQGMGALRIVDRGGRVTLDLPGSHAIAPGPSGPEFVIAGGDGMERWNAAAARAIGDRVRWQGGRPDLVTGNPHIGLGAVGTTTLYRAAPLVPLPMDGALFGEGVVGGKPVDQLLMRDDGTMQAAPRVELAGAYSMMEPGVAAWDARRGLALTSAYTASGQGGLASVGSTIFGAVHAYAPADDSASAIGFESSVWWMALSSDGGSLLVGLASGDIHELDPRRLEPRARWNVTPALKWLLPLDADQALAGDGADLWVVGIGAKHELHAVAALPGLGPVDMAALAPDRRHVALASGSDVRIALIE